MSQGEPYLNHGGSRCEKYTLCIDNVFSQLRARVSVSVAHIIALCARTSGCACALLVVFSLGRAIGLYVARV